MVDTEKQIVVFLKTIRKKYDPRKERKKLKCK